MTPTTLALAALALWPHASLAQPNPFDARQDVRVHLPAAPARTPATARRSKVDQITDLVLGARRRILFQRRARDHLDQLRVARTETDTRFQVKGLVRAFRHAQQQLFQYRRQLALAQHQRGRGAAEGGDDVRAIHRGKAIMQREVGRLGNDRSLRGRHKLDNQKSGKALL